MMIKNLKSYALILLLFASQGLIARTGNINLCRWHTTDKIEASDYQLIRKEKLFAFLSNDNDNIYINLKVEDQAVQERILKEGLTIWINMDNREIKQLGIRFPIGSQNQGSHRKGEPHESKPGQEGNAVNLLSMANSIEIIGFTWEQERHFSAENADNFRGSVKFGEKGILYYKLLMPLARLPVRNAKSGHGAMPFTLGIEYGSRQLTNKEGQSRGPAPSSIFRPAGSGKGAPELTWINSVTLATSK
jgi:hypothetical protein